MGKQDENFEDILVENGQDAERINKAIRHILTRMRDELKDDLYYHGVHHTLSVMRACKRILKSEAVNDDDANILLVAAAYHDCGFLTTYRNHEEEGCRIAKESLNRLGFTEDQIDQVLSIIMSTKLPQTAKGKLDQILCDADLDYLGGEDFEEISDSLRREFLHYGIIDESVNWIDFQLDFFDSHHYWTNYAIQNRKPKKDEIVNRLKSL